MVGKGSKRRQGDNLRAYNKGWDRIYNKPKPKPKVLKRTKRQRAPDQNWTKITRMSGLVEWQDDNGVGHPDYESAKNMADKLGHMLSTWMTHGCNGNCSAKNFPGNKKKKTRKTYEKVSKNIDND